MNRKWASSISNIKIGGLFNKCGRTKKPQILFTTHSEYAIKPLPHEAVWAVLNGRAIQGKPEIDSLRSLMGEFNSEFFGNKVFRLPGEAPESYAFLATWCEYFSEKVDDLISQFYDVLPSNDVWEAT